MWRRRRAWRVGGAVAGRRRVAERLGCVGGGCVGARISSARSEGGGVLGHGPTQGVGLGASGEQRIWASRGGDAG